MDRRLFARRVASLGDSNLKEVLESFPGVISFAGGLPDEKAFPVEQIDEIIGRIAKERAAWQYLPTEGSLQLREAVARHVAHYGIRADVDNVLITQGSQQALDLICMALIDPGDPVLMEAPGYLGAIGAVQNYEADIRDIPVGDDGIDPARLGSRADGAKFLYTVSTHHNPTGCSIPARHRPLIYEAASSLGFLIVEDEAYRELTFEGTPSPPIKAWDEEGRVVYMGSFSKSLVPGVRVGWIIADREIIRMLALLKQSVDLASNTLGQLFVLHWLNQFGLRPPIQLYREKRDLALAALQAEMPPDVTWNRPQGGFFLWVRLPEGFDASQMLPYARANGVTYVPGAAFRGPRNTLRFSFSQVAKDDILPGVQRLARTIEQWREKERAGTKTRTFS